MRWLLLLFLALPVWCDTPEAVVRKLYTTHLKAPGAPDTVKRVPECFTPGFLEVIKKAQQAQPGGDKPFVDWDIFSFGQIGFGYFEVGSGARSGGDVWVPVKLWVDRGSEVAAKDVAKRKSWPYIVKVNVRLTDLGQGYQIRDLLSGKGAFNANGTPKFYQESPQSLRGQLQDIAEGRWPQD